MAGGGENERICITDLRKCFYATSKSFNEYLEVTVKENYKNLRCSILQFWDFDIMHAMPMLEQMLK